MKLSNSIYILLGLFFMSWIMHSPHMSKDIMSVHSWRQCQTQSNIDNFFEEDFNILNPRRDSRGSGDGIYRMEFPLMQLLVAGTYKLFGQHIAVTRWCMLLLGFCTLLGFFTLVFTLTDKPELALIGSWAFNFSPCFYYYTINPLPDNMAMMGGVWALAFFFLFLKKRHFRYLGLSALFFAVGALCKLPFILYFSIPFAYAVHYSFKRKKLFWEALIFIPFLLISVIWYTSVISTWQGNPILYGITNLGTSWKTICGYFWDNAISTLPETLLNYASVPLFLAALYWIWKEKQLRNENVLLFSILGLSLLAYYVFEINQITNVHDYYLMPFLPLLFLLVTFGASRFLKHPKLRLFLYFLLILMPLAAFLRMQVRWDSNNPGFNKDLLIYKKELRTAVPDSALCIVGNDESYAIWFHHLHKKGWGFCRENLSLEEAKVMKEEGAQYLISDSRTVEGNVDSLLDSLLIECGTIRIFEIK